MGHTAIGSSLRYSREASRQLSYELSVGLPTPRRPPSSVNLGWLASTVRQKGVTCISPALRFAAFLSRAHQNEVLSGHPPMIVSDVLAGDEGQPLEGWSYGSRLQPPANRRP